jgi:hypothetical protein
MIILLYRCFQKGIGDKFVGLAFSDLKLNGKHTKNAGKLLKRFGRTLAVTRIHRGLCLTTWRDAKIIYWAGSGRIWVVQNVSLRRNAKS